MKTTGLSSRIAAFSSPFASAGVLGTATSSPGMWRYIASRQCEWVGPSWWPAPCGIRITSGTFTWPPNMYRIEAAQLMIWSSASNEKLIVISSTIGPQPGHRGADARADDRVLRDRRVAHALLAELLEQALRHLERALEDADVLAHDEDALVGAPSPRGAPAASASR